MHTRATSPAAGLRLTGLFVVAVLLMQAAWILAVPPYRAVDEIDHAYRAAHVGAGHWLPATEATEDGRGRLVTVPRSIPNAASDVCARLTYVGPDNCHPVEELGADRVVVGSAATDQSSLIYVIVGQPIHVLGGEAALYAMRAVAALLCALMLGLAFWAVNATRRGMWPLVTLFLAMTPIVVYSSIIPSGNGLEMVAGIALWCTLMGLAHRRSLRFERALLGASIPAVVALCSLRQLGPGMALMIFGGVALLLGTPRLRELARTHRRLLGIIAITWLVCTAVQAAWVLWASSYPVGAEPVDDRQESGPSTWVLRSVFWLLQSFAAFPAPNELGPVWIYAVLLLITFALWAVAMRVADRRTRIALMATTAVAAIFPWVVVIVLWRPELWQGRYSLAVTVGVFLIAGHALDRAGRPTAGWLSIATTLALGVVHASSVLSIADNVQPFVSYPVIGAVVMALGWLLVLVVVWVARRPARDEETEWMHA